MHNIFRHAFALQIADGKQTAFRCALGQAWTEITALLDAVGAANFSLWGIGDLAFGYFEMRGEDEDRDIREEKNASDLQKEEETEARSEGWNASRIPSLYAGVLASFADLVTWISMPHEGMRLMYQDFGIVRQDKNLIRHRVFATHLKGDFQEEYKRRHDALVEARGDAVNPGPDSNFSIWNAGQYIFGYDEIDTTMEEAETQESRSATIAWETKMLEIMDWFTDDVDWITGERHPHVLRLAYYK